MTKQCQAASPLALLLILKRSILPSKVCVRPNWNTLRSEGKMNDLGKP
jgi:hypothetical protein